MSNLDAITIAIKSAFDPVSTSADRRFRTRQRLLLTAALLCLAMPYVFLNLFDKGISSGQISFGFSLAIFMFLPCSCGAILFGFVTGLAMRQKKNFK